MATLEELLKLKYGRGSLEELTDTILPRKTPEQKAIPTLKDDSPYGKIQEQLFKGLQKYGPSTFKDTYRARESAEDLTNVLGFVPGIADVLDFQTGEYLKDRGETLGGIGLQTLATLPLIPGRNLRTVVKDDMSGGGAKLPPPTSTPTAFETVLTTEDFKAANKYTSRPATTVIEESVVNNPKFKKLYPNPDKPYEIDNMLTLMGKYGGDNRNVKEQINLYVSPELKAKGKVTTRELLNDIADNKPRFTEYKAKYEEGAEKYAPSDQTREMDYLYNSPFVARYDNPTTVTEAQQRKAPIDFEHKSFYINPTKEGQTYNITNTTHPEVSQGFMANRTSSKNKVFHSRQYTYNIDGKIVSIPAEGQSGAYKMFEKAEDVPYNFSEDLDMGLEAVVDDIVIDAESPILDILVDNNIVGNNVGTLDPTVLSRDPGIARGFRGTPIEGENFIRNLEKQIDDIPDAEIDNQLQQYFDTVEYDVIPTEEMRSDYRNFIRDYSELNIKNLKEINASGSSFSLEQANTMNLRRQEVKENFIKNLQSEMGMAVENYDPKKLPLFNEWFNVHMKTSLQDAANSGVDEVWFPVNDYAVARQRGETLSTPQAVRIAEFESDGELMPIDFKAKMQPSKGATEMAKKYKKFTEKGLNAIERDYGVKLDAELFTDANNQEFYKINLTPELKDELSTLKLNRGGLATLMPLRY
jgi:hypothetical protein